MKFLTTQDVTFPKGSLIDTSINLENWPVPVPHDPFVTPVENWPKLGNMLSTVYEKLPPASLMRSPEKVDGCPGTDGIGLGPSGLGANVPTYPNNGAFDKLPENLTQELQKSVDEAKQETQYDRQRPGKWNGRLEVLSQLTKGPCPDGGIISKLDRDVLVKAGLVLKVEGWNQLSTTGTAICLSLGLLKD